MTLLVRNTGSSPLSFEAALHTYFAVSDIRNVSVSGLQGTPYLDKVDAMRRKTDNEPAVRFTDQVDRTYLDTKAACTIDDTGWGRKIVVAKTGSRTTVVWNPAQKRATELTDIGPDAWAGFVCVETANVGQNQVTLPAGQTHEMRARVSLA
jgi:glucose-6-phosphate 1-epimerase